MDTLMRRTVTDAVAWFVHLSVYRSVTLNPAKTAEPIEMSFGCGLGWVVGPMY